MSSSAPYLSNDELINVLSLTKTATAIHIGEEATIQFANDAMISIWGKGTSVIGKSLEAALPELKGQPFIEMFEKVWREGLTITGKDTPAELLIDGVLTTVYFDFEYRAIKNECEETICILHSAVDVTDRIERRQALKWLAERDELLLREQALNEELAASVEELRTSNEDLQQTQESLSSLNNELEHRIEARIMALAESEERFLAMAEASDILIAVGDESGNAVYFSKAWIELTGRSIEDLLEFGWVDLVHPDDRQPYVDLYLSAFAKQEPFTGEFRVLNKQGDYRWLLAKGPPRFRPDGSFAGYISSCWDITDRKKPEQDALAMNEELAAANEELITSNEQLATTEESLRNKVSELAVSEKRFRSLIERSPIAMQVFRGEDMTFEIVNDAMLEFLGKTSAIIGKTLFAGVPEIVGQPIVDLLYRVYRTGEPMEITGIKVILHRNNRDETGYYNVSYRALTDDGNITGVLGIAIDVTAQVVAIQALQESEEKLKIAINTGKMGTWSVAPGTLKISMSDFVRDLLGFPLNEEVTMASVMQAINPEYHKLVTDALNNALEQHVDTDIEYPINNLTTGEEKWVKATGKLLLDAAGNPLEYTGMFMDITERKLDEIRKNDFIGMVSHELKTPLTSLTAIVQVANAKLKNGGDAFLSNALDKANIQVKKMSTMINGFLNISRLESGKILLEKKEFSMPELLTQIIDEISFTTSNHKITLLPPAPAKIYADPDKIGSVISNLLSNAVKYSPKGHLIEVQCKTKGKSIEVSVKDDGMGIRATDIEHLFDRYYRVDNPNYSHISGFGIGLYLSAEIIRQHGGEIWVKSTPGEGSTFYFSLPEATEIP